MKKIFIIILLTCLQSMFANDFESAFGQQPTLNSKESEAITKASNAKTDIEAIEILSDATKNKWAGSAIWFNLANVQMRTNSQLQAVKSYEKSLEILPAFFAAQRNLSFTLSQLGKDDEAFKQMRKTLALSGGGDLQTLLWITSYYSKKNDYTSALNFCNQALLYNPDNRQALLAKSIYLFELCLYDNCEVFCQNILKDDSDNIDILRVLGKTRAKKGEFLSAISIFEIIEKSSKSQKSDTKFFADLLFKEGFYKESAINYLKIADLESLENPVMAMIFNGDFENAKIYALKLNLPMNLKALGLIELETKKEKSDVKYLNDYLSKVYDDSYVVYRLADFYYQTNDYTKAQILYKRLENDVTYSKSALYSLMNISIKRQDYLQALYFANEISKYFPSKEITEYAKKLQQYCTQLD